MLINKLGTEAGDDVAQLNDRRPTPYPKNRETMTTLLQTSMSPVTRAELLTTPTPPPATVVTLDAPSAPVNDSARTDVA